MLGGHQSAPRRGRISVQSPIGKALMGRKVGDCVEAPLPRGKVDFEIIEIRYGGGEP